MAKGIGPGDAVFCPAFTFCATAEVVALVGATPVFADVEEESFNLDPKSLAARDRDRAQGSGLKPKAVIPVDLFGQPADHDAHRRGRRGREACSCSTMPRRRSARPTSNRTLGTLGAGDRDQLLSGKAARLLRRRRRGASPTTTSSREILRSLRVHGEGRDKYDSVRIGMTGRLDTIQAAVLIEKLKIFPDEIAARDARRARAIPTALADVAIVPRVARRLDLGLGAIHHPRSRPAGATRFAAALKAQGIPTAIYYPKPLHRQAAYRALSGGRGRRCRSASGWPTRSSACRCTPISTSRPRTASSRRCARALAAKPLAPARLPGNARIRRTSAMLRDRWVVGAIRGGRADDERARP